MKCCSLGCSQNFRSTFFFDFFLTTLFQHLFICSLTNITLVILIVKTSQIVEKITASNFIVITKKNSMDLQRMNNNSVIV